MFNLNSDFPGEETTLGAIDWNAVINQGFAVGSQAINAFSGAHGGAQVGYNSGSGGIFAIQATPRNNFDDTTRYQTANPYAGLNAQQIASLQSRGGLGLDDAAGSITGFVQRNPLLVGAAALGAFLLFKEPPRRR